MLPVRFARIRCRIELRSAGQALEHTEGSAVNLLDIVRRDLTPEPWSQVSKIPWDEPAFSQRMLAEHLTQNHDAASRRTSTIDAQVAWIDQTLLASRPSTILDLGCGPGLYCHRLARLSHHCTGIDFGPASVSYARERADAEALTATFIEGDLRATAFGDGYDLIMLLFGEFNTFTPNEASDLLQRARSALAPGGALIIEAHTFESIRESGQVAPRWSAQERGLFSEQPHIRLDESSWNEATRTAIDRHYVLDVERGDVSLFGTTTQAYTREEYEALAARAGFSEATWRAGWPNPHHADVFELLMCV